MDSESGEEEGRGEIVEGPNSVALSAFCIILFLKKQRNPFFLKNPQHFVLWLLYCELESKTRICLCDYVF